MLHNKETLTLEVLEELFLDQLEFRVRAVYLLLNIQKEKRVEILSLLDELKSLTRENIAILHSADYAHKS